MSPKRPVRVIASTDEIAMSGDVRNVRNVPGNYYDKHGSTNPLVSFLMSRFHRGLVDAIGGLEPKSILDVGCGEGRTTDVLIGAFDSSVIGADLEESVVREAAIHVAGGNFITASVFQLPFPDKAFDVVMATEVLEHLDKPELALEEMKRVAKDAVVVTVPHEPWWRVANVLRLRYLTRLGNTPGHVQHWTKGSFEAQLRTQAPYATVELVGLWLLGVVKL